jgi:hypothetical protein
MNRKLQWPLLALQNLYTGPNKAVRCGIINHSIQPMKRDRFGLGRQCPATTRKKRQTSEAEYQKGFHNRMLTQRAPS